jgi:hypothetical protein
VCMHEPFERVCELYLHKFLAKYFVILLLFHLISFVHGTCCDLLLSLQKSVRLKLIEM